MSYVIVTAIGLLLIFEGVLPFIAPELWRKWVKRMAEQSNRALHVTGFICMFLGVMLVFISHHYLMI